MSNVLGAIFSLAFCFGIPLGAVFLSDAWGLPWLKYIGVIPFIIIALVMLLGGLPLRRSYDDDVPGD